MKNNIHIYTDGACKNNPGPGGFGVVYCGDDHKIIHEMGGHFKYSTNNEMELLAVLIAIEFFLHYSKINKYYNNLKIYTDSSYVEKTINIFLNNWVKNNWIKKSTGDIKNIGLWKLMYKIKSKIKFKIIKVKAHSGIILNERADTIASEFAYQNKINLVIMLDFEKWLNNFLLNNKNIFYSAQLTSNHRFVLPKSQSKQKIINQTNPITRKTKRFPIYLSLINNALYRDYTWDTCEARVKGVSGVKYKKVKDKLEEEQILIKWGIN